ncbi:hypothetical protein ACUN8C_01725 [Kushneria sp. Sum13]|uniref:hypothetical protein n=1 Tax=Kushneria sp. Sum13 TaxID=3459196 RepID=UPI004045C64E
MTGLESTAAGIAKWAVKRGYEHFTIQRLEKALDRAERGGVSIVELCESEHRFAHFVHMVRALEKCSNQEMADYLMDLMIGGVRSGMSDDTPDLFQIVLGRLGSLTCLEVRVIAQMHSMQMYDESFSSIAREKQERLISCLSQQTGFDKELVWNLIKSMRSSGFIEYEQGGYIESSTPLRLTNLSRELISLLHYQHQLL